MADERPVLHIYIADKQPATRYRIPMPDGPDFIVKLKPRTPRECFNCGERRWAANLYVQAYADGIYFFCKDEELCERLKQGLPKAERRRTSCRG